MFGLFPGIAQPAQQRAEAGVAEQDAGSLVQIEPQPLDRPDGEGKPQLGWIGLEQRFQQRDVATVGFARTPAALTVTQASKPLLAPVHVPVVDCVGRDQHNLRHLVRRLAEKEQPKRNRPLPHFRFWRALDHLLDLAQVFRLDVKVNTFWHPSSIPFFA